MFPDWLNSERGRLFELLERDQLPHALLIHGPAGTGRRLLALSLIGRLLDFDAAGNDAAVVAGALVDEEAAPRHPDFRLVQVPPDKQMIPVDDVRELISFLHLTSHQCGYKVALLNPAHAMSENAANSLLKTLEEPPGSALIVLVTDALSRLPPTIVSRCHRVRVAVPSTDAARGWLEARDRRVDWAGVLAIAGGAPIRALEFQQSGIPEQISEFAKDIDALELRRASPASVARRWAKSDADICLTWLYQRVSDEIRDLQIEAENLNMEPAFALLRQIGELRRVRGGSLNADLQLSGLLSRWYGRRAAGQGI